MPFDDEDDRPPGEGVPGAIRRVVRGGAAGVPIVGGLIAELVDGVLEPVTSRQLNDWLYDLARRIRRLEETRGISEEDLRNPAFVEAAVKAARQAMIESSREKREALRNGVLNTLLGRDPGTDRRHLLLRCVEELTPTHFQILKVIRDGGVQQSSREYNASQVAQPLSYFISRYVPELSGEGDSQVADLFCLDLLNRGLVKRVERSGRFVTVAIAHHGLTDLGNQLLDFITTPPESDAA